MGKNPASKAFLFAMVISIVLPFIPILKWGLLPFDLLNTHLHEMFHAFAALATGGQVDHIEVYKSAEGVTLTRGGISSIILMAGYLGASLFGAIMVIGSRNEKYSKFWLRFLAVLVLVSSTIWVRGDALGWMIGFAWPILILFGSFRLKGQALVVAAQFLAVQQCLNSIKSLRDLVILSNSTVVTDAQMLANITHIPAMVWAIMWLAVSLFGIGVAMVKINKIPVKTEPEAVTGQLPG